MKTTKSIPVIVKKRGRFANSFPKIDCVAPSLKKKTPKSNLKVKKQVQPTDPKKNQQPRTEVEKQILIKAQHKADKELSKQAELKRKEIMKRLRHQLCEDYPEIFNTQNPKPLALKTHLQVRELYPDYSNRIINMMLEKWTKHHNYVQLVKDDPAGCKRYDLIPQLPKESPKS